jgi:uncharacterized repeat protein (TIGR04138 family)
MCPARRNITFVAPSCSTASAILRYGLMARTVFRRWGIEKTDDFGEIVFNLVEATLMSKTNEDSRRDFQGVYDLDRVLVDGFRINLEEAE